MSHSLHILAIAPDALFAEPSLPSATLGKVFAECFSDFAECFRHSAKQPIPVVILGKI
jgi:hypothetical protein